MATCRVRGCEQKATNVFEIPNPPREYAVCEAHFLELGLSPYTVSPYRGGELIVGEKAPPGIIDYTFAGTGTAHALVTLTLGRDGTEEQRVQFLMSREHARGLAQLFGIIGESGASDGQS